MLELLGKLTQKGQRKEAAKAIANQLNAHDLIIFIRDEELNVLLPGQGFDQSLSNGKVWRQFLSNGANPVIKGQVPVGDTLCTAIGVKGINDSLAVLIGGEPGKNDILNLSHILAIIVPLLIQEQITNVAVGKGQHSTKLAEKAERLTSTLESIRLSLMEALEENFLLLHKTKQQNEDLAAANEELRASHEEVLAGIEELNVSNQKLLSINADLDNFIYTASHDLKSPISNIEGLMYMLKNKMKGNGWEDETTAKIIEMINVSIKRFRETISDLTEVAKVGKESAHTDIINIKELISDVQNDLFINVLQSNAEIKIDVNPEIAISFSRKNLKSIIYNLLSNAIKYCHPDRTPMVQISLLEDSDYYVLSYKDNGIGMDTSDKSKIFGLFKRLHTHVEGTGIGLYIVKKIIEDAGGKIELESKVGEGTTFWIYFRRELP